MDELSEFPRLRAIAAAREVDVAALANASIETLLASEPSPGDAAGLALELEDLKNYLQQVQRYRTDPLVKRAVFGWLLRGTDAQPLRDRRRTTEARLSLRDVLGPVAAAALPLLRAHQLHQIAELELGSQIHACRRAPRRTDGRWLRRARPLRQRRQSHRDAELPALPAHARLPRGDRERHPSDRRRLQFRRNVRGSGEPGVHPSRQVPGEARAVVDADPGEVLRAFRAEPLPKFGVAATGKAHGFQAPGQAKVETAAVTERPASRTPPSRPRTKSAPTVFSFPFASLW